MAKNSIDRIVVARRVFGEVAGNDVPTQNPSALRASPLIRGEKGSVKEFQNALFDDLNVSDAMEVVFDLIKEGMKLRDEGKLTPEIAAGMVEFLNKDFDQVFDIFPKEKEISDSQKKEIEDLIEQRKQFRAEKNWAESDRIRDELLAQGIELLDEAGGTTYKLKS